MDERGGFVSSFFSYHFFTSPYLPTFSQDTAYLRTLKYAVLWML